MRTASHHLAWPLRSGEARGGRSACLRLAMAMLPAPAAAARFGVLARAAVALGGALAVAFGDAGGELRLLSGVLGAGSTRRRTRPSEPRAAGDLMEGAAAGDLGTAAADLGGGDLGRGSYL